MCTYIHIAPTHIHMQRHMLDICTVMCCILCATSCGQSDALVLDRRGGNAPYKHVWKCVNETLNKKPCRVSVDAGITTDVAGNFNTAASQVLKFRPPSAAVSAVSKAGNAVIAGSIAASLATSLLTGLILPPLSPPSSPSSHLMCANVCYVMCIRSDVHLK